jgi:hypothetical protein
MTNQPHREFLYRMSFEVVATSAMKFKVLAVIDWKPNRRMSSSSVDGGDGLRRGWVAGSVCRGLTPASTIVVSGYSVAP